MTDAQIEVRTKKAIGMFLDLELLAKVDAAAAAANMSRAGYIRQLLISSI